MNQNRLRLFALEFLQGGVTFARHLRQLGLRRIDRQLEFGVLNLVRLHRSFDGVVVCGTLFKRLSLEIVTNREVVVGAGHIAFGTLIFQGTQMV